MASELATLRARVAALEDLCGAACQLAGTVGAPRRILNAFAAAAAGKRLPKSKLLPVFEWDCGAIKRREAKPMPASVGLSGAAAKLGRQGGSKTSPAKAKAAQENGRKGGRPRMTLTVPFRLGAIPAKPGDDPNSMKIEY